MRFGYVALIAAWWTVGVLAFVFWPEEEIVRAPGALATQAPSQRPLTDAKSWIFHDKFLVTPLAAFELRARVLSKKKYWFGREASLAPVDLALGWGRMSDQQIVEALDITQHSRWYFFRAKHLPIPMAEIAASSSNMHMIPASDEIESQLGSLRRGDILQLSGFLVRVRADDGWNWRSSLSRTDSGAGACEVVWVEKLSVEE